MIKSISYWSMPGGLEGSCPLDEAITLTRQTGFTGIELGIAAPDPNTFLHIETDQAACEAIRKRIDASGLVCQTAATGLSWGCNPVSDDPAVRRRAIDMHAAALRRTAWLGCSAMLMVPGVVGCPFVPGEHVRYDHAIERCREAIAELLDVAERQGVDLCIENVWNGLLISPLELRDLIDSFKSERLGVYFDLGNVLGYHQYPPHWIELLGSRIKRVHIKDFKHDFDWHGKYAFCDLLEGDVPFEASIAALRAIGYDKTIVAEMLPYRDGQLERASGAMDKILAM